VAQYRPVEPVGGPESRAEIVEDDDGFRILLIEGDIIPVRVWQHAYDAGVAMIVIDRRYAISTDDFAKHRVEQPASMSYTVRGGLRVLGENPSYRDYLNEETADAAIDPLENTKFVHLHTHTEYSQLDGLSTWDEILHHGDRRPARWRRDRVRRPRHLRRAPRAAGTRRQVRPQAHLRHGGLLRPRPVPAHPDLVRVRRRRGRPRPPDRPPRRRRPSARATPARCSPSTPTSPCGRLTRSGCATSGPCPPRPTATGSSTASPGSTGTP
jgi:hypothetical protein